MYDFKEVKNVSDFFYKEKMGPLFSPVITLKNEKISPVVVSAIDNLLSPDGNMFTRAETVRNLMKIEKIGIEETSKSLSISTSDVANKLRLLEFSGKERSAILEHGFSEKDALQFLKLDKISRLYGIEFCNKNGYSSEQIAEYVDRTAKKNAELKVSCEKKIENVRKFVVNDIGFFINSIENAMRLAKTAGFEVENEKKESNGVYDIHIRVKRSKKDKGEVDKNTPGEYNI